MVGRPHHLHRDRRRVSLDELMKVPLVRCDQVQWSLLGISMAGWNAILSLGSAALITAAAGQGPRDERLETRRPRSRTRRRCCASTRPANTARPAFTPASSPCLARTARPGRVIARMARQEERHLKRFDALMAERGCARRCCSRCGKWPASRSAPQPPCFRNGRRWPAPTPSKPKSTAITASSSTTLGDSDPELAADIANFRAEELEHRDTAREHGAADTIGYPLLTAAIRAGCRLAIGLSKRI